MSIIEKTYKHKVPTAKEFFDSFREKYSSRSLPGSWQDNPAWTAAVLQIFAEIGRNYGYRPQKEYLDIDMTFSVRHEDTSVIAVAIEHDNGDLDDVIDDEMLKLMDTKAYLKVLMFYPGMPIIAEGNVIFPEMIDKIRSARIKIPGESYLLITPVIAKGKKGHADGIEVFACSIGPNGELEELESFLVEYEGSL